MQTRLVGMIDTVHASIVHLLPALPHAPLLVVIAMRPRSPFQSDRNPRDIGKTRPCTAPGHAV
jgi:hypothetical protein